MLLEHEWSFLLSPQSCEKQFGSASNKLAGFGEGRVSIYLEWLRWGVLAISEYIDIVLH